MRQKHTPTMPGRIDRLVEQHVWPYRTRASPQLLQGSKGWRKQAREQRSEKGGHHLAAWHAHIEAGRARGVVSTAGLAAAGLVNLLDDIPVVVDHANLVDLATKRRR